MPVPGGLAVKASCLGPHPACVRVCAAVNGRSGGVSLGNAHFPRPVRGRGPPLGLAAHGRIGPRASFSGQCLVSSLHFGFGLGRRLSPTAASGLVVPSSSRVVPGWSGRHAMSLSLIMNSLFVKRYKFVCSGASFLGWAKNGGRPGRRSKASAVFGR
jgi:hypothetical protein